MTEQTFLDKFISTRGHLVHKIKAKDSTGRWANYFVYVRESREAEFLKAIGGGGNIDLEDYGDVLASCYGESFSDEVVEYLYTRYGFKL